MHTTDHIWQRLRELTLIAETAGEIPVAAIVTCQGNIIAEAHNEVETRQDVTAHAEMLAIQRAAAVLGNKYLNACDMYVTLEPCPMCAAAIAHAKIRRLYFAAYDAKAGAVENGVRLFHQPTCHHQPEVYGGIREAEYSKLLKNFFSTLRS